MPAEVRRRWATDRVMIEDYGTGLRIEPLPDDPIGAAFGSLPGRSKLTSDEMRRRFREEEGARRRAQVGSVVLDAYALIAFLRGEQAGAEVKELLHQTPAPSMSAANLAEVVDRLMRADGRSDPEVRNRIDLVIAGGMEVEPVWLTDARRAGSLRARHYDRQAANLSLADCFCLATAIKLEAAVATSDPALARAARAEGVGVIPLPDRSGQRP